MVLGALWEIDGLIGGPVSGATRWASEASDTPSLPDRCRQRREGRGFYRPAVSGWGAGR